VPGISHLLLAVQLASAAGHRTCLPEVPAEADLVRNYQGTVLRPALSRRESAGVLIGVAGEQLLVLGRQPCGCGYGCGYRAGQVLRSDAESLLLRKAVLGSACTGSADPVCCL
jgi:hypothetical protein